MSVRFREDGVHSPSYGNYRGIATDPADIENKYVPVRDGRNFILQRMVCQQCSCWLMDNLQDRDTRDFRTASQFFALMSGKIGGYGINCTLRSVA